LVEKERVSYNALVEGKMKSVPGVIDAIKKLSKKYKMALATSSKLEEAEKVLSYFKIKKYFDEIITVDDVKNGKPDPEIYLLAAKRLNVPVEECVVFEDAAHGVDAAKAAGMRVVAVTTNLSVEKLNDADMILDNFEL
jgi:HAD superfamily hydrolase (TIGR01509 family)